MRRLPRKKTSKASRRAEQPRWFSQSQHSSTYVQAGDAVHGQLELKQTPETSPSRQGLRCPPRKNAASNAGGNTRSGFAITITVLPDLCEKEQPLGVPSANDSKSMTPGKNRMTVRPVDYAPSIVPDEPVLDDHVGSPASLHSTSDDVPFRSIVTIAWIVIGIVSLAVFATVWLSVSS